MDPKKRLILMVAGVLSVIAGVVLYVILAGGFEWHVILLIIIVVMFLAYAIPKYIVNRKDVVGDDEYSRKLLRIAASRSYLVSLYTWLAMMWLAPLLDDTFEATSTKIGFGIGIMAIVFLANILIVKFTGVKE